MVDSIQQSWLENEAGMQPIYLVWSPQIKGPTRSWDRIRVFSVPHLKLLMVADHVPFYHQQQKRRVQSEQQWHSSPHTKLPRTTSASPLSCFFFKPIHLPRSISCSSYFISIIFCFPFLIFFNSLSSSSILCYCYLIYSSHLFSWLMLTMDYILGYVCLFFLIKFIFGIINIFGRILFYSILRWMMLLLINRCYQKEYWVKQMLEFCELLNLYIHWPAY